MVEGKIIAYDLPSENMTVYNQRNELKDRARAVRVYCVSKLHSLGLQCTESVIIVSPSRINMVDTAIDRVQAKFEDLNELLRSQGLNLNLRPQVEVIEITPVQREQFTRLAERRLTERLDESIDNVSRLIDSIAEITEVARRRVIRYRLTRLGSEWRTIQSLANELGIQLGSDFEYLIDLIDQAERRVR
jgi:hypothetical protein